MQVFDFVGPNLVLVLGCLGIAQALFLTIYLFTLKSGNRTANILLGLMLLGLTIRIGKAVIYNYMYLDPWIRNLGIAGFLLVGPCLWLYGKALIDKKQFHLPYYLHFIPFVLFVTFSKFIPNKGDFISITFYTLIQLHLGVYTGLAWYFLYRSQSRVRKPVASWYFRIALGVSIIWFLYVGIFIGFVPFYLLGATSLLNTPNVCLSTRQEARTRLRR